MERDKLDSIKEKLQKTLSKSRYEHTLGVAYTAYWLAVKNGIDHQKAEMAALLHDCAKGYGNTRLKELMSENYSDEFGATNSELMNMIAKSPQVLHAVYGVTLARKVYGVDDLEILSAIRWHTTGKPEMNLLEKIVYVADCIEPNRSPKYEMDHYRKGAFVDIESTFRDLVKHSYEYLLSKNIYIDEMSKKCLEYYEEKI